MLKSGSALGFALGAASGGLRRLASPLHSLIEGLGGDIRSVWPRDRSSLNACLFEEAQVVQRRKYRASIQILREIDITAGPVVKDDVIAVAAFVLDLRNVIQIPHDPPSFQWGNLVHFSSDLPKLPVGIQIVGTQVNPFPHQL